MINFLKRLFGLSSQQQKPGEPLPPMPPEWNRTLSDMMEEMNQGKRKSVGSPESDWAQDYERSLLPDDTRFPQKGDLYSPLKRVTVSYITIYAAPYSLGGEAQLLPGEQVVVCTEPVGDRPLGVYLDPLDYAIVEKRIVPEVERTDRKYGGFCLFVETSSLNNDFELIDSDSPCSLY